MDAWDFGAALITSESSKFFHKPHRQQRVVHVQGVNNFVPLIVNLDIFH